MTLSPQSGSSISGQKAPGDIVEVATQTGLNE
jgi:hypothetical protein